MLINDFNESVMVDANHLSICQYAIRKEILAALYRSMSFLFNSATVRTTVFAGKNSLFLPTSRSFSHKHVVDLTYFFPLFL